MRARAGYTLIELAVTVVIAGLALPPLLNVFTQAALPSARPDLHTAALNLAREQMEVIAADKFNTSRGYAYLSEKFYPPEDPVPGFLFSRTVSFSDVASSDLSTVQAGSGYRKAVVTVSWDGGASSVILRSVFTDH